MEHSVVIKALFGNGMEQLSSSLELGTSISSCAVNWAQWVLCPIYGSVVSMSVGSCPFHASPSLYKAPAPSLPFLGCPACSHGSGVLQNSCLLSNSKLLLGPWNQQGIIESSTRCREVIPDEGISQDFIKYLFSWQRNSQPPFHVRSSWC